MTSEEKIINGRTVYIFGDDAPSAMVIQPVGDHEGYTDKLYREIKKITEKSMCFTTFKVTDWNSEMSPWDALPVFGEERFGHDARSERAHV